MGAWLAALLPCDADQKVGDRLGVARVPDVPDRCTVVTLTQQPVPLSLLLIVACRLLLRVLTAATASAPIVQREPSPLCSHGRGPVAPAVAVAAQRLDVAADVHGVRHVDVEARAGHVRRAAHVACKGAVGGERAEAKVHLGPKVGRQAPLGQGRREVEGRIAQRVLPKRQRTHEVIEVTREELGEVACVGPILELEECIRRLGGGRGGSGGSRLCGGGADLRRFAP